MQASVATLPRLALNLAVAQALGMEMTWSECLGEFLEIDKDDPIAHTPLPDYCAGGRHLMMMMSRYSIMVAPQIARGVCQVWQATSHAHRHNPPVEVLGVGRDADPAIAIIRCFLECEFGEMVEVPEQALGG
jgi:hypothetical protein